MSAFKYKPLQVGLTGSIGMGKSAITKQLKFLGFPVFDADAAVHELYAKGGAAVLPIQSLFPEAVLDERVDRTKLASYVLNNTPALQALEQIVHPLVAAERMRFYSMASDKGEFLVVYDIPLLLENRDKHQVDYIIVATADRAVQESRVLNRPGMTREKFESILKKQVPDEEKRKAADFLVFTDIGEGFSAAKSQLASAIEKIIQLNPDNFEQWKSRPAVANSQYLYDAVAFDLDDTLVPTMPPLLVAYDSKYAYMEVNMPRSLPEIKQNLRALMLR
jgi:dephospho-CoA kinase